MIKRILSPRSLLLINSGALSVAFLWFLTSLSVQNQTQIVSETPESIALSRRNGSVQIEENLLKFDKFRTESVLNDSFASLLGNPRPKKGFLTIGIPSIKRQVAGFSYVKKTIESIIRETTAVERESVVVMVMCADMEPEKRAEAVAELSTAFPTYLQSGFLLILQVSPKVYPPLTGLKRNYGDAIKRVSWRSKQNVDFAWMFYSGRHLSDYYLQIEDDVTCAPQFLRHIRSYIQQQDAAAGRGNKWAVLEFSELGFIGKLYRSNELARLARFLLMFYDEQPVDWLFRYHQMSLTQKQQLLRKPTLFQHQGEHSSLDISKGLNKLKDRFFAGGGPGVEKAAATATSTDKVKVVKQGDNPEAESVISSMEQYAMHAPQFAYNTAAVNEFFWAKDPAVNDTFCVLYAHSQRVKRVTVVTGGAHRRTDRLRAGVLEACAGRAVLDERHRCVCSDHVTQLGVVDGEGRVDVTTVQNKIEAMRTLRLRVLGNQTEWLVVEHIGVYIV